ncbi:MAG: TAXI family TRAP transporter solute-binding subunit [Bacillota bacterium]
MSSSIKVLFIIVLCLVVSFGCTVSKTKIPMATGAPTGIYESLGNAYAELVNEKSGKVYISTIGTSGSVENCKLLEAKKVKLSMVQNDILDFAYKGAEVFEGEKISSLRAIASLYSEVVHIVVRKDSNIKSLEDLKGKRLSVGSPGSGVEVNSRQIFTAAGMSYNDIAANFLNLDEAAAQFKQNLIDGFIFTSGTENATIQELASEINIALVPLSDEIVGRLEDKYHYMSEYIMSSGTYIGQDKDIKSIAVRASLVTRDDVPESLVYELTKLLFDSRDSLTQNNKTGLQIKLESALNDISIPIHRGAERYYREKGIIK